MASEFFSYFMMILGVTGMVTFAHKWFSESLQSFLERPLKVSVDWLSAGSLMSFASGALSSIFLQSRSMSQWIGLSYSDSGLVSRHQLFYYLLASWLGPVVLFAVLTLPFEQLAFYLVGVGAVAFLSGYGRYFPLVGKLIFSLGLMLSGVVLIELSAEKSIVFGRTIEIWLSSLGSPYLIYAVTFAVGALFYLFFRSTVSLFAILFALLGVEAVNMMVALPCFAGGLWGAHLFLFINSRSSNRSARGVVRILFASSTLTSLVTLYLMKIVVLRSWEPADLVYIYLIWNCFHSILSAAGFVFESAFLPGERGLKKEPQVFALSGPTSHLAPVLALNLIEQEIQKLAAMVDSMLRLTRRAFANDFNKEDSLRLVKYEKITDSICRELTEFLDQVSLSGLTPGQVKKVRQSHTVCHHLESLADHCKAISLIQPNEISLDEDAQAFVKKNLDVSVEAFENVFAMVTPEIADHIPADEKAAEPQLTVLMSGSQNAPTQTLFKHLMHLQYEIESLLGAWQLFATQSITKGTRSSFAATK